MLPNPKRAIKRLVFINTLLVLPVFTHAIETPNYQLGISAELPTTGSFNIDEDNLYGVEAKYFFAHTNANHFFLNAGYRSDSDKSGLAVDVFDVGVGGQYDFAQYLNIRNYVEYSVGATYITEDYSIDLLDNPISGSFNEFGARMSLGVGWEFGKHVNTKLAFNQYTGASSSTTIGLTFSYSF